MYFYFLEFVVYTALGTFQQKSDVCIENYLDSVVHLDMEDLQPSSCPPRGTLAGYGAVINQLTVSWTWVQIIYTELFKAGTRVAKIQTA